MDAIAERLLNEAIDFAEREYVLSRSVQDASEAYAQLARLQACRDRLRKQYAGSLA